MESARERSLGELVGRAARDLKIKTKQGGLGKTVRIAALPAHTCKHNSFPPISSGSSKTSTKAKASATCHSSQAVIHSIPCINLRA